jgi:hypothetical protein
LFVFVAKNAFTQDTILKKERSFFKNTYFTGRLDVFPYVYELTSFRKGFPFTQVGISKTTKNIQVDLGMSFKPLPINQKYFHAFLGYNFWSGKNPDKALFFSAGFSYYYFKEVGWGIIFNNYVPISLPNPYGFHDGIRVYLRFDEYLALGPKIYMKYKRFGLSLYNLSLIDINYLKDYKFYLQDMLISVSLSYNKPLYKTNRDSSSQIILKREHHSLFLLGGVHTNIIHEHSVSYFGSRSGGYDFEKEGSLILRPNISTGLTYRYNNFISQINIKGPFLLSAELAFAYNLQPLFNKYTNSFTGFTMGYSVSLSDVLKNDLTYEYIDGIMPNLSLGLLHITKRNWYYGFSINNILPNKELNPNKDLNYTRTSVYINNNMELKLGYYFGLLKK